MSKTPNGLIGAAALEALGPLGLVQKGRSRVWLDDHGWWLITVEFQPAIQPHLSSVNVGYQHLWIERSYIVMEEFERPMGGSATVDTLDDEAVTMMGAAAASAVGVFRERHRRGRTALEQLARSTRDDLTAGIACGLLGEVDRARRNLQGTIHASAGATARRYLKCLDDGTIRDHAAKHGGRDASTPQASGGRRQLGCIGGRRHRVRPITPAIQSQSTSALPECSAQSARENTARNATARATAIRHPPTISCATLRPCR